MVILVALSVALLALFLSLFIYWSFRDERAPARWIRNGFLTGVLAFAALFGIFTWHSLGVLPASTHADHLTAQVVAGKVAWQKYLCIDCHTILGNGAYYAPDLTKSWTRFLDRAHGDPRSARLALAAYLRHPPGATADRRGMPDVKMSETEAAALVEFLKWTSEIDTNGWPPSPRRAIHTGVGAVAVGRAPEAGAPTHHGETLFADRGCAGCHSVGAGAVIGPDLAQVGRRYDRATIIRWMTDPSAVYAARGGRVPINKGFPEMPSLGITEADAGVIADYLIERSQS